MTRAGADMSTALLSANTRICARHGGGSGLMKRIYTYVVIAGLTAAAIAAATVAPAAQAAKPQSVIGTVRDAAGKAVDGALVSIRNVNQTFTTSVYTDEKGEYVTPPL